MDKETLTAILVQVLTSNEKWQQEVERNVILQQTVDELFTDEVFQLMLENSLLPKYQETGVPHYRAVEMICGLRELARQIKEGGAEKTDFARELEDILFKVSDKWGAGGELELRFSVQEMLAEAGRLAQGYKSDPQFSTRLDRFRLLVLPLSVTQAGGRVGQVLVLENIRPPRSSWTRKSA